MIRRITENSNVAKHYSHRYLKRVFILDRTISIFQQFFLHLSIGQHNISLLWILNWIPLQETRLFFLVSLAVWEQINLTGKLIKRQVFYTMKNSWLWSRRFVQLFLRFQRKYELFIKNGVDLFFFFYERE